MTITPDQADKLAQRATPGPWMLNPHGCILVDDGTDDPPGPHGFIGTMYRNGPDDTANGELMAAAPDLAQTIAGMTVEYALETLWGTGHDWAVTTGWFPTPERAWADLALDTGPTRLVRRFVTEPEVAEP